MRFVPTRLPEVVLIEPDVFRDDRGLFLETFHAAKYAAAGLKAGFVQDNHSLSTRGTLRGLHAQARKPQGKLVRVIEGEIFDVAVDIRPGSKTFGRWVSATLSAESFRQIFVPPGFAHGFCVLSERAQVEYKCTELYDKDDEIGVRWDSAGIAWPLRDPLLSPRDAALPSLEEVRRSLEGARR